MKKLLLIASAIALTATSVSTEQNGAKSFPLTVDSIMRGPELVGNPPNNFAGPAIRNSSISSG